MLVGSLPALEERRGLFSTLGSACEYSSASSPQGRLWLPFTRRWAVFGSFFVNQLFGIQCDIQKAVIIVMATIS